MEVLRCRYFNSLYGTSFQVYLIKRHALSLTLFFLVLFRPMLGEIPPRSNSVLLDGSRKCTAPHMIKCMGIKDFGPSGSDPAHIESNRGCILAKGSRTGL